VVCGAKESIYTILSSPARFNTLLVTKFTQTLVIAYRSTNNVKQAVNTVNNTLLHLATQLNCNFDWLAAPATDTGAVSLDGDVKSDRRLHLHFFIISC